MSIRKPSLVNLLLASVAVTATAVAIAQQPSKDAKHDHAAGQPEMQLPPGWTPADMQACGIAATPGKMHEHMMKDVGTWVGTQTMWMFPGSEPAKSECSTKVTGLMDGRYIQCEVKGDMPGMGPFHGMGIYGYDNSAEKFQCSWIDNCGTTMGFGSGALSPDGKTMTWTYTFTCPLTKKPTTMRQVDVTISENSKTSDMFATDPKSGKEYKMLHVEYTRKQ